MARKLIRWHFGVVLLLSVSAALAQWTSQTIPLRPGWNAVFLELQPEPRECDAAFAGIPIKSAWFYNSRFTTFQFIQDTNQPIIDPEKWLVYFPPGYPLASNCSLYSLDGGRPYMIELPTNAAPIVNWTIRGSPVNRSIEWTADSLNFVGFVLPTNNPPTVQAFFASSTNLSGRGIWRLDSLGRWVFNDPSVLMRRGEAFWIRPSGLPDYSGPLQVTHERRTGLDFGQSLGEQTLFIRNGFTNARTIVIRQQSSELPPSSSVPALAGPVPLSYWQNDFANNRIGWTNLPMELARSNLPSGATWELRLAVRRPDMAPFSPPQGIIEFLYESLLEVVDSSGNSRRLVPVIAKGMQAANGIGGGTKLLALTAARKNAAELHPRSGLWVGSATLDKVSQPSSTAPTTPLKTPAAFQFRLILHVDGNGQASLLQHVVQMWQSNALAGDGTTNTVGQYVLAAKDSRLSEFSGSTLRNGQPAGRRFSSAAFSFRDPILMRTTGGFGDAGSSTECTVALSYTNALNPFLHRYHPDHDNLDDRYRGLHPATGPGGPQTTESFSVRRDLVLTFSAQDPDGLALSGWGDRQIGGDYTETIYGLHQTALVLKGTFRLNHASREPTLNQ